MTKFSVHFQIIMDCTEYVEGDSLYEVYDREQQLEHTLFYYANAIINANDDGDYDDAWIHVDMFLKEFDID